MAENRDDDGTGDAKVGERGWLSKSWKPLPYGPGYVKPSRARRGPVVSFEVRGEGDAAGDPPRARRRSRLPAIGAALAGLGIVTRIEPGRLPSDDDPGAVAVVRVRAEEG